VQCFPSNFSVFAIFSAALVNLDRPKKLMPKHRMNGLVQEPPLGAGVSRADAARQLAAQERDSERTSRLFLGGAGGGSQAAATSAPLDLASLGAAANPTAAASGATESDASGSQGSERAFLDRASDRRTTAGDRLVPPVDPNVVQAGSIIPAAPITGIRSDLPGQITAQVTR
jgi:type IV secretion system protein TrbI